METTFVYTIDPPERRTGMHTDYRELIAGCGCNTGNVCFVDAVAWQVRFEKTITHVNAAEALKEEGRYLIPAANWIGSQVMKDYFLPLEGSPAQTVAVGLGIQTTPELDTPGKIVRSLDEDSVRAVRLLGEHSVSIGVRGAFTAEVCRLLGVTNLRVIGCPSFYELSRKFQDKLPIQEPKDGPIACNVTPGNPEGREYEHKIIELARDAGADLVMQDMRDMPGTLLESLPIEERHIRAKFPGLDMSGPELERYLRAHGRIFYLREEWERYFVSREISFSFGSRFHGNMMALTSGVPALWVVHDGRTREMTEAMGLPHIDCRRLEHIQSAEELRELCSYPGDFEERVTRKAMDYLGFLEENDIAHTFPALAENSRGVANA